MATDATTATFNIALDNKPKNGALVIVLEYLNGTISDIGWAERNGGAWSKSDGVASVTESSNNLQIICSTLADRDLYATLISFPDKQIISAPEK